MSDIRDAISALGADAEEIAAAEANGTLLGLAAERLLLPGTRSLARDEVAESIGIDPDSLTKLWLALGFPQRASGEKAFSAGDVEILRTLFSDGTTTTDYMLHEARVISSSMRRIAEVLTDEMWDQQFGAGQSQSQAIGAMAGTIDVERFERMMLH